MRKQLKTLILVLLSLLILLGGGCQGARELNKLVIVMGIGIDSDQEDINNVKLTAQIVLPSKISGSQQGGISSGSSDPYYNLDVSASNTFQAVRDYTHIISGKLYIAHTQVFVIGQEMAEKGFSPNMDFFVRAKETRPTSKIAISETTASDVLSVKSKMDMLPATNISKLIDGQVATSQSKDTNFIDYINAMQSSSTSFMAPLIHVEQNNGEKVISVNGMAVFKKDKMVGELNGNETRGVLWVLGKIQSAVINVNIADGIASFEVLGMQSKVSPVVSNGKIVMKVSVYASTELSEQTCEENLATSDNIKKLQTLIGEAIKNEIMLSYSKAVSLDADVFGFGEMIHKYKNSLWHEMESDWDKIFKEITLNIKTEVSIKSVGSVEKPVWDIKKE